MWARDGWEWVGRCIVRAVSQGKWVGSHLPCVVLNGALECYCKLSPSSRVLPCLLPLLPQEAIEAGKWARGPWAGSLQDEMAVQRETGATLRCFPLQQPTSIMSGYSNCLYSGYQAMEVAIFARTL